MRVCIGLYSKMKQVVNRWYDPPHFTLCMHYQIGAARIATLGNPARSRIRKIQHNYLYRQVQFLLFTLLNLLSNGLLKGKARYTEPL